MLILAEETTWLWPMRIMNTYYALCKTVYTDIYANPLPCIPLCEIVLKSISVGNQKIPKLRIQEVVSIEEGGNLSDETTVKTCFYGSYT